MSHQQIKERMWPLHHAVCTNNIDKVQKLLQTPGVDVNATNSRGNTALHVAKEESIVRLLIKAGAGVNLQNNDRESPLLIRLENLKHSLHFTGGSELPLGESYARKLLEIITLLLEAGASPNIQDRFGFNSLHLLFEEGGIALFSNLEGVFIHKFMYVCMSLFLRFNADVNMQDFKGFTPLHYAVEEAHVINAEVLINSGASVDAQDYRGMTPLLHMFNSDNTEMIKLLLQRNASVNAKDKDGRTTLSRAVEVGNELVVQLLLQDSGTFVSLEDKNGVTPLHLAAASKGEKLAKMLIRASADLNARDIWNATPLHYAAHGGKPKIVSRLLEAGADPKLTDKDDRLPAQYSLSRHNYHTTLKFGEEYRYEIAKNALCHARITRSTRTDDIVAQSLPVDGDEFTVSVSQCRLFKDQFDSSMLPRDLRDSYMNAKCATNVSVYLHRMCLVPGVGQISTNIEEIEIIKQSVTEFMSKLAEKVAEIDPRFKGTLLPCGSVFDGTKVGDLDEFDYMLDLEELLQVCMVTFDHDTKFNEVAVLRRVGASLQGDYKNFFDRDQLDSNEVMGNFVEVAYRALVDFDYTSVHRCMYVDGITGDTLDQPNTILCRPGIVTCKLKLKWTGSFYKQLVITVDLVPAIPVREWPHIAREVGGLLTEDITSHGCHVVAKDGHWRLSFSRAESLIMGRLSQENKSALIGAKVMLNPTVSCKIILCNDDNMVDDDGEVIADTTLLPSDIVSTYMLKNLFFNCIEENAKDTAGRTVTTGQIFSKLFQSSTGSVPVRFFFVPGQTFVGKKYLTTIEEPRLNFVLATMIINSLLN